jgi:hypothetical protein
MLLTSQAAMFIRRRKIMGDFKRLVAWQKAHAFVVAVHTAFEGRSTTAAACAPKFCVR